MAAVPFPHDTNRVVDSYLDHVGQAALAGTRPLAPVAQMAGVRFRPTYTPPPSSERVVISNGGRHESVGLLPTVAVPVPPAATARPATAIALPVARAEHARGASDSRAAVLLCFFIASVAAGAALVRSPLGAQPDVQRVLAAAHQEIPRVLGAAHQEIERVVDLVRE